MSEAVEPWRHVGRVYTNGQQFLVLDIGVLAAWRATEEQIDELVELGSCVTTLPVGDGIAGIVAVDASINDEGWLEVFQRGTDHVAIVQGLGSPYRDVMVRALSYSSTTQADDAFIEIGGDELVLWDSALDGAEDTHTGLHHAVPRRLPADPQPLHAGSPLPPAGLRIPVRPGTYQLDVRWRTALGDGAHFARWLLKRRNGQTTARHQLKRSARLAVLPPA
ncbi:hypothetical protein [Asanoa siamensis]|uniref:Uncharacterized protein n=1 Tax=Asanoa siamensis TaxID=926357 RepID=A0ABQ4D418_9ACTN|nr:hypothetical protein [Asanoa siamensis]GIF78272.1 hypothetical protein Asi02nite_77900 [Asanoa siamensis]